MKKYFLGFLSGFLLMAFSQFAFALVNPNYGAEKFTDVMSGDWYVPALTNMVTANIIHGYSDNTFKPGNAVNRAEASVMLDNTRQQIHKNMDEIRFVLCYGTSTQANENLSTEDQKKYDKIRSNFCEYAKGTLLPGYSW